MSKKLNIQKFSYSLSSMWGISRCLLPNLSRKFCKDWQTQIHINYICPCGHTSGQTKYGLTMLCDDKIWRGGTEHYKQSCWRAHGLHGLIADWMIEYITDWLTTWQTDWIIDWLTDNLTDWLNNKKKGKFCAAPSNVAIFILKVDLDSEYHKTRVQLQLSK